MYGLSPVATSSKVLEYQGKSGFFQPNTVSKQLVEHLSSASDKKVILFPGKLRFSGVFFWLLLQSIDIPKSEGTKFWNDRPQYLAVWRKMPWCQRDCCCTLPAFAALCSGCRIADGDLFLNGLACFWVNMPPYRFPHCIGPSSLSGHFLDASISVG